MELTELKSPVPTGLLLHVAWQLMSLEGLTFGADVCIRRAVSLPCVLIPQTSSDAHGH